MNDKQRKAFFARKSESPSNYIIDVNEIEKIDQTNRKIDSVGSEMLGGIRPLGKKGVKEMVGNSRKVGTEIGEVFDYRKQE